MVLHYTQKPLLVAFVNARFVAADLPDTEFAALAAHELKMELSPYHVKWARGELGLVTTYERRAAEREAAQAKLQLAARDSARATGTEADILTRLSRIETAMSHVLAKLAVKELTGQALQSA